MSFPKKTLLTKIDDEPETVAEDSSSTDLSSYIGGCGPSIYAFLTPNNLHRV